jgi:ribosomal protein S18 acetylase RimI-like enzyme
VRGRGEGPVPSPSESERFGLAVGRLTVAGSGDAAADAAAAAAARETAAEAVIAARFDLVIVRLPIASRWRSGDGMEVVDAGCAVTFAGVARGEHPLRSSERLRAVEQWDDRHAAIVEEIFAGYRNHVAANPRLDASVVPAGYADWSARHVDGSVPGDCFVMEDEDGDVLAFAAVAPSGDELVIDLAGVMPAHRGRGLYQRLLDRLELVATERGLARVVIATQVTNTVAVHAWQRRGWTETGREWTVHVVRPDRDGRS